VVIITLQSTLSAFSKGSSQKQKVKVEEAGLGIEKVAKKKKKEQEREKEKEQESHHFRSAGSTIPCLASRSLSGSWPFPPSSHVPTRSRPC